MNDSRYNYELKAAIRFERGLSDNCFLFAGRQLSSLNDIVEMLFSTYGMNDSVVHLISWLKFPQSVNNALGAFVAITGYFHISRHQQQQLQSSLLPQILFEIHHSSPSQFVDFLSETSSLKWFVSLVINVRQKCPAYDGFLGAFSSICFLLRPISAVLRRKTQTFGDQL